MFGWFGSQQKNSVKVDIHSHLLPGIDDGVRTWEEALAIIAGLADTGFKKIITTPHIHSGHFLNSAEDIRTLGEELRSRVSIAGIPVEVEYAAEYMVDEHFMQLLQEPRDLLYFGKKKYVLIETGFRFKSLFLNDALFGLQSKGYRPVLAHPERYDYLLQDLRFARDLHARGVHLQVSGMSLEGYYGNTVKSKANALLKQGLVDFIGSDLHRQSQLSIFTRSLNQKPLSREFINNQLL